MSKRFRTVIVERYKKYPDQLKVPSTSLSIVKQDFNCVVLSAEDHCYIYVHEDNYDLVREALLEIFPEWRGKTEFGIHGIVQTIMFFFQDNPTSISEFIQRFREGKLEKVIFEIIDWENEG